MNKSLIIFLLISFLHVSNTVKSQNHFIKIIDFDSLSQSSQQIVRQDDYYLLGYYQTCTSDLHSQCSGIIKIDTYGKIVDKVILEKFSNNSNSILIDDGNILLTGEEYNDQVDAHEFLINIIDKSSLNYMESVTIKDSSKPLVVMSQLANTRWNDKYVLAGDGRLTYNTFNRGVVYVLNNDFSLDTLILFDFANKNIACWNVFVDSANRLNVCLQYANGIEEYTSIMKFDTTYKKVWQWRSPNQLSTSALPYGFETKSGDIILNLDDLTWGGINRVYSIKQDSTVNWIAQWPGDYNSQSRYIDRLRQARNGDIIGVGRYSALGNIPRLERVPFIFRLDPNGNFKWIKTYYKDQKYTNGRYVQGGFSDVIEADNGDLIAVGRIHNVLAYDPRVQGPRNDWDIIVARLGADGCLEPGCNDINKIDNLIVDVEEMSTSDDIKIYPNPFHNYFKVEASDKIDQITVYNNIGQLVSKTINIDEIDLSIYNSGLYYVEIKLGKKRILKKVVKE